MALFRCLSGGGSGLPELDTEHYTGTTANLTTINTTKKPIGIVIKQTGSSDVYYYYSMKDWNGKYFMYIRSNNAVSIATNSAFTYTDTSVSFVLGANYGYDAYVIVE